LKCVGEGREKGKALESLRILGMPLRSLGSVRESRWCRKASERGKWPGEPEFWPQNLKEEA